MKVKAAIAQLKRYYSQGDHIALTIWTEEDVKLRARCKGVVLGHRSAARIIDEVEHHHDCTVGVTWDTLDCYICDFMREHPHYRRCKPEDEEG